MVRVGWSLGLALGIVGVSLLQACAQGAQRELEDGGRSARVMDAAIQDMRDAAADAGMPPAMPEASMPMAMPDAGVGENDAGDDTPPPPPGPCENGEKDGFETGTDCGGPDCDTCPIGQGCITGDDCDSAVCTQGICDCDVDSDGDGTNDCDEQCPRDPNRTEPGVCGCVGEPDPAPATTECSDSACPLSTRCDGLGRCGREGDCASPAADCGAVQVHGGHAYFFCTSPLTQAAARSICVTAGYDLAHVDDMAENDFLRAMVTESWIGATDADTVSTEGTWVWQDDGVTFWMGDENGAASGGLFNGWDPGNQPDDAGGEDCAVLRADGTWNDLPCSETRAYVCEGG